MAEDDQRRSKKRGPKGLASSQAKKRKASPPVPDEGDNLFPDHETKTIALSVQSDEEDEVGELQALYRTAVTRLQARDAEGALSIVNGTIHEADRILRNKESTSKLPYQFYAVYASALLDLSFLKDDDSSAPGEGVDDYVQAAIERCDEGLENGATGDLGQMQLVKAKCICCRAQRLLNTGNSVLNDISRLIDQSIKFFNDAFKVSYYVPLQLGRPFNIIQDFADSVLEERPKLHETLNKWVVDMWTRVLSEDQEDVSALEGCGRVWLSLAQPALGKIEGIETDSLDSDASEMDEYRLQACSSLETSVELLNQALKCAEKSDSVSGELCCLLAEATISLANTFDEGPHYTRLEKEAFNFLTRADQLEGFELPIRFKDMMDEMKDTPKDVSSQT